MPLFSNLFFSSQLFSICCNEAESNKRILSCYSVHLNTFFRINSKKGCMYITIFKTFYIFAACDNKIENK